MNMNWLREQAGMEVERHPVDKFFFELCPQLTIQQRLFGYAGCLGIGFILNIGSWTRLVKLAQGEPGPFVTLFTIGNIISIFGSFFLNGPYAQGKKMIGPQMRCATVAYLLSMILTFVVAFHDGIDEGAERVGLVILLIFVQYMCMIWFIICSVWFLKTMVLACLKGTCTEMCPSCAKGCKCVCETLEDGQKGASTMVSKAAGKKKEDKKGFLSMSMATSSSDGKQAASSSSSSFFPRGNENARTSESSTGSKPFFSMGNNQA